MSDIVTNVAAVIDNVYFVPGQNTQDTAKRAARAAVKVAIICLRDNISARTSIVGFEAIGNGKNEDGIFVAMLSQALKEIEEDSK